MDTRKIHKDLRVTGSLLGMFHLLEREWMLRKISKKSTEAMEHWNIRKLKGKRTWITRSDGSKFRVCILNGKKSDGQTRGILWLHGGGYVLGGPEMVTMNMAKHLLKKEDCIIIAPDYTLSHESPYPAALKDCYQTLIWMDRNRDQLGINGEKFIVGGESAGGGLTVALALLARDRGLNLIDLQIPLYPMLDDRDTESSIDNDAPVWNTKSNHAAWKIYLGELYGNEHIPIYASPAREENVTNLPPAISVIGTIEPFYQETKSYFRKLQNAGIATYLMEAEGCFHAFDMLVPHAGISKEAIKFVLEAYEKEISDETLKIINSGSRR